MTDKVHGSKGGPDSEANGYLQPQGGFGASYKMDMDRILRLHGVETVVIYGIRKVHPHYRP
jgi:hypothetical protein